MAAVAISVGSVEVDVIPNTRGISNHLRASLVPAATRAGQDAGDAAGRAFGPAMQGQVGSIGLSIGQQIGQQIADRITASIRGALRDGITQGGATARGSATRQGQQAGGAFAREMRARIEAALRSLPDVTIGADTTEADADIQALRAQMEALASKRIGVDIDAADARAQVAQLEEDLRRLGAAHPNPTVRADTAAALAQLRVVREEIDRISADPARVRVETDGTFGQRLRAAVQQAEASLPNINIDASTSEADAQIANLRAQLTALRDVRIGIDMDAATALARVEDLQARLQRLSASDADVAVRVDAAAAQAQLAQVRAMVAALDGKTANVNVSTRQAVRALMHLSVMIAAIPAIPAVPVLAAGIGSIAAAATAAGAGVGALAAVAVPAFMGIGKALQAQKAAQDAASTATAKGGQTAAQAASRALQLAGAQQALAAAERNGARQIAQAQAQVRQAKQAVADAVAQAAQRQQQAARAVQDAERQLAAAQRDARQAQRDLTAARREAAQQLEDLNNRLTDSQLSQRDAEIALIEATAERDRVLKSANATELDKRKAVLAYDQAVQRLKEQTTETKRLKAETAAANKAGVAGSTTVRSAQDRLVQAQRQVADRARAVRDAQTEAGRVQVETARQVAAAQERVGEATRNVAVAQQNAAEAVASAQRQIQSAQLSAARGANQAAVAQEKYRAALAKLTPSARGTFDAFVRLSGAFSAWSRSLQPQVMPIFTRALNGLKNSLPGLTPFVRAAADAIGVLQDKVSRGFGSPWWKSFKTDLAASVKPAIVGLGTALGNVFKTIGGIVDAFLPHMDSISARMQAITGRWAKWATGLKGSPAFEGFLRYSSQQAPILADALGKVGSAFYQVSRALAPLAGPVLTVLGVLADGIATVARHAPWLVQGIYAVIIATKLWTLAQAAFNFVMSQFPLVRIGLLIVALVGFVIYAYNKFSWFRTGVQAVWSAIQTAVSLAWSGIKAAFSAAMDFLTHGFARFALVLLGPIGILVLLAANWRTVWNGIKAVALVVWNTGLKPIFTAIWTALKFIGSVAMWLWRNAIGPAFKGIWTAAKFLLTVVAVLVIGPLVLAFRLLAAVGKWLWRNVLAPAFRGIGAVFSWLWRNILKPYIALIALQFEALAVVGRWLWKNVLAPAFRGIGAVAKWLWDKGIGPAFRGIASAAEWLWDKALRPVFSVIKKAVGLVAKAFSAAKDGIGKSWDKLKGLTKKPIAWIIDIVYNKGVVGLWNAAASVLPIKKLKKFNVEGFSRGGVLDGYQARKKDDTWYPMRRGEGVLVPEVVRGIGASTVRMLNDAGNRGGVAAVRRAVGFARGGIVGDHGGIGDWIGGKVSAIGGIIGKAKDWVLGGVAKLAEAAAKPIRSLINRIPGGATGFGRLAKALPTKVLNEALNFIRGSEQSELAAGGQWIKPVNAPFGTRFGARGSMWASGRHTGLDFPAALGAAVRAVSNGRVAAARSGGPYGNHILVAHGGGLSSLYAHLSKILVRSGRVTAGQRIGSVGATGNVTGPHLHLEARRNGRPVDPMTYLTGGGAGGFSATAKGANQRAAKAMLSKYGWPPSQFGPLKQLWQHESGWNHLARNPSSGAYGIPQSLPAAKMASSGSDWRTNPVTQIKWGLGYIRSRYGSPAKAWSFWQRQSPHWYDSGGYLPEGLSLAYNGTGRPERVLTASQERALLGASRSGVSGSEAPRQVQVMPGAHIYPREAVDVDMLADRLEFAARSASF